MYSTSGLCLRLITGYKLRKHIAKALQARSSAIRNALEHYNKVARNVSPPRPSLHWDEVVEYTFLSNFDLLRDARQDVSQRPWATPTGRPALDTYFKRCRAEEEIVRLNVEIHRVITYIRDEDAYLRGCEDAVTHHSPVLAHQILLYRNIRARYNADHLDNLHRIAQRKGFSGTLAPGKSTQSSLGESASLPQPQIPPNLVPVQSIVTENAGDTFEELEDEEDEEDHLAEVSDALQNIIEVVDDT